MKQWKVMALAIAVWALAMGVQGEPLDGQAAYHHAELLKSWADIGKLPNLWEGSWQVATALYYFPGPVAYTPEAAQYVKDYKPGQDSPMANCVMPGMPFVLNQGAMPIKFFPSPGMIALYIESYSITRFIHVDGRPIDVDPNPTFLGTSVGHWEGDTLVVDTRGFVPSTLLQIGELSPQGPPATGSANPASPPGAPGVTSSALSGGPGFVPTDPIFKKHGPNLRFVERIRMTNANTLKIETSIYDETIFAKPYTSTREWHRHTGKNSDPQEWVCSDNRDFYNEQTKTLEYNVRDKAHSTGAAAAGEKK
jgi:hypothetical protein